MTMTAVDVFCVACGKDRKADGISGRCLTCGKPTRVLQGQGTTDLEARAVNPNGTAHPTAAAAINLPPNAESRRWLAQTRAMAEGFTKAAEKAERTAREATAEAERLRKAAAAFTGLLPQVTVDEGLPKAVTGSRLNGRWSRSFERCIDCGRVDRRHAGKGLCTVCQQAKGRSQAS